MRWEELTKFSGDAKLHHESFRYSFTLILLTLFIDKTNISEVKETNNHQNMLYLNMLTCIHILYSYLLCIQSCKHVVLQWYTFHINKFVLYKMYTLRLFLAPSLRISMCIGWVSSWLDRGYLARNGLYIPTIAELYFIYPS